MRAAGIDGFARRAYRACGGRASAECKAGEAPGEFCALLIVRGRFASDLLEAHRRAFDVVAQTLDVGIEGTRFERRGQPSAFFLQVLPDVGFERRPRAARPVLESTQYPADGVRSGC